MSENYPFKFTWIVHNFSVYPMQANYSITSPSFTVENLEGSMWYLKLNTAGDSDRIVISSQLHRCSTDIGGILWICYKFETVDRFGKLLDSQTGHGGFEPGILTYGRTVIINRSDQDFKSLLDDTITIRCYIASKKFETDEFTEFLARTRISFHHCCFKWSLRGYESSLFSSVKKFFPFGSKYQFEIDISTSESKENFDIKIRKLLNQNDDICFLLCRISLLNDDGVESIAKQDFFKYDKLNQEWLFPNFLTKKVVQKPNATKCSRNDTFQLLCDIYSPRENFLSEYDYSYNISKTYNSAFENNSKSINISDISVKVDPNPISVLLEDFRMMHVSNTQTDIILRSGENSFPAHKYVLSARSSVFRAMFQHDMAENNRNVVEIEDMDSNVLKTFLHFLYTGKIESMDADEGLKLILAAEKYQIASL